MPALTSLSEQLRQTTAALHHRAEHSGVMRDLLRRSISRSRYAALIRNLFDVYESLEEELSRHRAHPCVRPIYLPTLFRVPALQSDLAYLHGPRWRTEIVLVPAAAAYVVRIHESALEDPAELAAHAYVRYLGDLSGGQILRRLVSEALRLGGNGGCDFYGFDGPQDAAQLKAEFRAGLDVLPLDSAGVERIGQEARRAFQLNIDLFEALSDESTQTPASAW